jgi:hypothetical protein
MSGMACPKCAKFYRVKKIGVAFEEGMPGPGGEGWRSYKLWMADLVECPECGAQALITAPGAHSIDEHYRPTYANSVARFAPIVRIDDCGGKKP